MDILINIFSFLFIITILVVIHELGHFVAAKSIGLKVEKFYVGFNLFGLGIKKKINETEFGIGLFPIGGYVKVSGMIDESLDEQYNGEDYEYVSKNMLQKVWFTSGGVIFNFILAFILFSAITFFNGRSIPENSTTIGEVISEEPAYISGMKSGDKITSINNVNINDWDDIKNQVYDKPNQNIFIEYERDGKIISSTIFTSSMLIPSGDSIGVIGIRPNFDIIQPTFFGSCYYGFNDLVGWLGIMSQSIISFFSGNLDIKNFGGPIQIASVAGEATKVGFIALINLMAVLSVNLGIINILPFPGLDGGHALIAIIEGIIGRRIPFKTLMLIQQVGVLLLILFFFIIMKNDISRLF